MAPKLNPHEGLTRHAVLSRRAVLAGSIAAAATAALAACTPQRSTTNPTSSATSTATPTPTPSGPTTWNALAKAITGTLLLPTTAGYDTARLTENPRFDDAKPDAILQVASAADVTAGLAYARNARVPVALRSGGHNYAGWSAGGARGTDVPASLVISTANLNVITLSSDGTSATIGPGAPLAQVYETLGNAGRAIGAGSCGTVGIGGLTLGGGVGVLVRSFGLTCDQLTAVEIVTADGVVHQASATTDADLFWACRGGGGGSVGIVTSMTFDTQPAPTVESFTLQWPWAAAAAVVGAWQSWAPTADNALWSTLKLLGGSRHASSPIVTLTGTWTGASGGLPAQLAPFLAAVGTAPIVNTTVTRNYGDAMLALAGCVGATAAACTTAAGGLLQRVAESGASHVPTTTLTTAGLTVLVAQVTAAQSVVGMTEGGVSLDALGGVVGQLGAGDTAFPYRDALMTVQYTATFADDADPASYDAYVRVFRQAMTPYWGTAAYVNYVDPSLTDPATSYFGSNLKRLQKIKKAVDPTTVFKQPHFL